MNSQDESPRSRFLSELADRIDRLGRDRPRRVAIDGVDAAGKTHLADELASVLRSRGRPVIRASIDGFHRPKSVRYRQGTLSPRGYYEDSFDHDALTAALLRPLGPGGDREYRTAVFDLRADAPLAVERRLAPDDALLLFDGVFLLRPELRHFWDFAISVQVTFDTSLARAIERDLALLGGADAVRSRYRERYIPGQRIYHEECRPERAADVLVHNDRLDHPTIEITEESRRKEGTVQGSDDAVRSGMRSGQVIEVGSNTASGLGAGPGHRIASRSRIEAE